MARAATAPAWFILEYLSAETWVDGSHGLPSPHPRLPLPRRFWFPGFTAGTGGLLRERGLFAARDAFRRDAAAQRALWSSLQVPPRGTGRNPRVAVLLSESRHCPLFSTHGPTATHRWPASCPKAWRPARSTPGPAATCRIRGIRSGAGACRCTRFRSSRRTTTTACSGCRPSTSSAARIRSSARNGRRAHSYGTSIRRPTARTGASSTPSSIATAAGLAPEPAAALRRFWRAWNGAPDAGPIDTAWLDFAAARPHLEAHADAWAAQLASLPDLAAGLVKAAAFEV